MCTQGLHDEFQNEADITGEEEELFQEGFETVKQNHIEMPGLKNEIAEIKESLDEISSWLDTSEESVNLKTRQ